MKEIHFFFSPLFVFMTEISVICSLIDPPGRAGTRRRNGTREDWLDQVECHRPIQRL